MGVVLTFVDISILKQTKSDLELRAAELVRANDELDKFNRLAVGREQRIVELKRQVNELSELLGKVPPHDLGYVEPLDDGAPITTRSVSEESAHREESASLTRRVGIDGTDTIRVLIIDDSPTDADVTTQILQRMEGCEYQVGHVETYDEGLEAVLSDTHDICLLDYNLGPHSGLDLLKEAQAAGCQVPIILITGQRDEELVQRVVASGAADYLEKNEIQPRTLDRCLRFNIERQRRRRLMTEQAAERSRQRTAALSMMQDLQDNHARSERTNDTLRNEIAQRNRVETMLRGRTQVLEQLEPDTPLEQILTVFVQSCEEVEPGIVCSIALADDEGKRLIDVASPNVPPLVREQINGMEIVAGNGTGGTAAATKKRVVIEDVRTSDLSQSRLAILDKADFRSVWSEPIISPNGKLLGIFAVFRREPRQPTQAELDFIGSTAAMAALIIDRHRAEAETRRFAGELKRSNEDLEQFAYIASHDLQEPLRKVSSFCSILQDEYADKIDAEGLQYLQYATDGANRMKGLVKDLLAYSRVDSQGEQFASVDVSEAVGEALLNLEAAIEEAQADITCDPLPVVSGDERQMVQLLQNLIGNAIKYRGHDPPRVRVSADEGEGEWTFSVSDNGIGIDPEFHQNIFGIFKRLHARDEYSGTGIGLAICDRIVRRAGGKIWVESEEGKGSTFRFTIPTSKPEA